MAQKITKKAFMEVLDLTIHLLDERINQNILAEKDIQVKMAKRVNYLNKHNVTDIRDDEQYNKYVELWYSIYDKNEKDIKEVERLKFVKHISK